MEEIGGFIDIELRGNNSYHKNALAVNSCRNALRLYIRMHRIKKIFIPYFTCEAVYNAIREENVKISFYHLNERFLPKEDLSPSDGELILYPHFWGINGKNVESMIHKHQQNILIDAAQAFFYKPERCRNAIYSPRKFFGVPDGGFVYMDGKQIDLPASVSHDRVSHLLVRYEKGATYSYKLFKESEQLIDRLPIMSMSKLTHGLLSIIDYTAVMKKRKENFSYLHEQLRDINLLDIDSLISASDVPLAYPLWIENDNLRDRLIQHKIFIPLYWPFVLTQTADNQCLEYNWAKYILALPIDQRYGEPEMIHIVARIKECLQNDETHKII